MQQPPGAKSSGANLPSRIFASAHYVLVEAPRSMETPAPTLEREVVKVKGRSLRPCPVTF
ncbi:hypothetical protein GCM10009690_21960 [Brevibacterium permense]|uniref:Uncharacterized protein n=1 Tax=Brevibacterium permense TaxID=234834 RepID=A0ABN2AG10_9MICO